MLHEFLRLSSDGIWRFDVERPIPVTASLDEQIEGILRTSVVSECNVNAARIHGFERPEALSGRRLTDFVAPDNPECIAYVRTFIESGYHLRGVETARTDSSGAVRQFSSDLFGVVENGCLVRVWGMQRDVTEAKHAELARAASEQQFKRLVDLVPQMLWVCGPDGSAEYWSEAGLAYFGKAIGDLSGWDWQAIIHPEDLDRTLQRWRHSLATGERYQMEYRLRRYDGEYLWHIGRANCERDAEGRIVRWYGTCADVHEQRVSQAALLRARDSAEEANRAKDQFLAVLSHELRTPLNPVLIAATELAGNPELPEQARDDARTIRQNVELEARIIDDLLDLTRITHGKLRMSFQALDMHAALYDVLRICGGEAQLKGVALILDLDASASWIDADDARIRQVLWNLLNNAIKFTPEGGRVLVRTSRDGEAEPGRIVVEVTDSGVGIEKDALGRIFNAFEQETVHGRRFGGLGLGLAISRFIADAHGGTLTAHSEGRGLGATFRFSLPLIKARRAPQRPLSLPAPELTLSSHHILLVEDHADTRRLLTRLLTKNGHSVRSVGSVADALAIASRESFDLLISDIGLPDGTGYDIIVELRKRRAIPGIALTGYGMEDDIRRAADAGFGAHLTKPVDFERLKGAMTVVAGIRG